jgi:hypothetical protein
MILDLKTLSTLILVFAEKKTKFFSESADNISDLRM